MSTPPRPPALKSLPATPTGPSLAEPTSAASQGGAAKIAARQGVPSSVRPDGQQGDGRYVVAMLHISAPKGAIPTATSRCACVRDRSAVGHRKVHALIADHTAHQDLCPLRTSQEGRTAA
ncbi:hypothetical protein [Streptomyces sp. NPDC000880]